MTTEGWYVGKALDLIEAAMKRGSSAEVAHGYALAALYREAAVSDLRRGIPPRPEGFRFSDTPRR